MSGLSSRKDAALCGHPVQGGGKTFAIYTSMIGKASVTANVSYWMELEPINDREPGATYCARTSGRGSGLVKPLRLGMTNFVIETASSTALSGMILFR